MKRVENLKYAKPQEVDEATFIFPSSVVGVLLPERHEIPEHFDMFSPKKAHPWMDLIQGMFFGSYNEMWFSQRDGVDVTEAVRHISAVLRSFQPKHEHKVEGAAYLMSMWMKAVATSDGENVTIWSDEGTEVVTLEQFHGAPRNGQGAAN